MTRGFPSRTDIETNNAGIAPGVDQNLPKKETPGLLPALTKTFPKKKRRDCSRRFL
jgi:hypothetical protein